MMMSDAAMPDPRGDRTRARNAEHEAREDLRRRGFSVLRSCETDAPVHLVAWQLTGGILLIRVVATRRAIDGAADVTALWRDDIDRLRALPIPAYCEIHIWVSTDRKGWHRYLVLPGGIAEAVV